MGTGVAEFGTGELTVGATVSEPQLALLIGEGRDPVTGEQLGSAFPQFTRRKQSAAQQTDGLDAGRTGLGMSKWSSTATAGFDFTFSVPKSVSVLWAVADAGTQALIVAAHHQAVAEVLGLLEREVAVTRAGVNARDGASAHHQVAGIAAAAFDHWDSRAGDPQLHTHVVVSNKVRTVFDGRWRALDSRPLFASVVALSEHYNAVLADTLHRSFGLEWEARVRGADRNPVLEIAGVGEDLVGEFSSRSRAIEVEKNRLIAQYERDHGRAPCAATVIKLRATATLTTRPEKHIRSLGELTADWRARATETLGRDATQWAQTLLALGTDEASERDARRGVLRADDISLVVVGEVARATVGAVSAKRSTWKRWNLWAEASRQTMGWRFATATDREAAVSVIVEEAKRICVSLTPPEVAYSPGVFRRSDGTSLFRPQHGVTFTSAQILAAEDRLLARADTRNAPVVDLETIKQIAATPAHGHALRGEQVEALSAVAVSGRRVDLLVGPAGAGKTTALRGLHAAWTCVHGPDSVVGLAPSAAAAAVLAEDLGIGCDNTAKWLHEHDHGRAAFHPGQLVIVDEATLAGTLTLDRITALAAEAGAKVLLVGDWAQLQSVDAGGAFSLLASVRDDTPELAEVHRFTHAWEKAVSIDLRHGRTDVVATYLEHGRVHGGTHDDMLEAAYLAWQADVRAGRSSLLITDSTAAMRELNERARAERINDGETLPSREVQLADGTHASAGDLMITRRNDRRVRAVGGGWVRNGGRWRITDVLDDGSVVAAPPGAGASAGGAVVLPAGYVAEHVDLGYAITAHRAQGATVDTAHVVVTGSTTRENLYVSMTRGREMNVAYVALDYPDNSHAAPSPEEVTLETVLFGVLQRSGAELSAHQMIEAEQEHWSSFAQLAAEYLTIAAEAQRDRWIAELATAGLSREQTEAVAASDSFGPLTAELRRAESSGRDTSMLLRKVVAQRGFADAADIGAVLISRVRHATSGRSAARRQPKLIAGLVPVADGPMAVAMRRALTERQDLLESRASARAEAAVAQKVAWLRRCGEPPADPRRRDLWMHEVRVVAAYRDLWQIDSDAPVGPGGDSDRQRIDEARARKAVRRAADIADIAVGRRARRLVPNGPILG